MTMIRYLFLAILLTGCSTAQLCLGTCDVKTEHPKVVASAKS